MKIIILYNIISLFIDLFQFTFISSLFPWPPSFKKVFLAITIILACIGELVLVSIINSVFLIELERNAQVIKNLLMNIRQGLKQEEIITCFSVT